MRKNAVKEKLKNGGTAYGAFVAYREPRIIEFMGRLGRATSQHQLTRC